MKRIFLLCLILNIQLSYAQEVVKWNVAHKTNESRLEITAQIADGWHLYSQHINNNVGPVPTSFSFMSSDHYTLIGAVEEPEAIRKYDENFEATLDFFEHEVKFSQKINLKQPSVLEGTITYMVCDETKCLPPVDYKYKLELK